MICCNQLQLGVGDVFFNIMSSVVVGRGQEAIAPYSISPMSLRGVVDGIMASAVPKSDRSMGDNIYLVLSRLLLLLPNLLDDGLGGGNNNPRPWRVVGNNISPCRLELIVLS